MILGLDVSTSITGATVIDRSGEVLYCEAWDMRNKNRFPTMYKKAAFIKEKLLDIAVKRGYIIEKVYVERNLQMFRSGFSSAKTLLTLAKFNGIVCYMCSETFEIQPEEIPTATARKLCGIKREGKEPYKHAVLKHMVKNEPTFKVQYTKHGNPKPGEYDKADSIVIARAGLKLDKAK